MVDGRLGSVARFFLWLVHGDTPPSMAGAYSRSFRTGVGCILQRIHCVRWSGHGCLLLRFAAGELRWEALAAEDLFEGNGLSAAGLWGLWTAGSSTRPDGQKPRWSRGGFTSGIGWTARPAPETRTRAEGVLSGSFGFAAAVPGFAASSSCLALGRLDGDRWPCWLWSS